MSEGMPTPTESAQRLLWLGRALQAGADEIAEADEALGRAEARYEQAHAKAVLLVADELRGSKALASERDAKVAQATYQEWLDLKVAERKLRKAKEDQRVRYGQAELARSLNAGIRIDAQLAGVA